MHLNYTRQPYESGESEISSEDDCSVDGENILKNIERISLNFCPTRRKKILLSRSPLSLIQREN